MSLVNDSFKTTDPSERKAMLMEAQKILIAEMPIAPLYFASFVYQKKARVNGVFISDIGQLDLKWATIDNTL